MLKMDSRVDLHYQTFDINKVKFVTDLLVASFHPILSPLLLLLFLLLPLSFLVLFLRLLFAFLVLLSLFSHCFLGLLAFLVLAVLLSDLLLLPASGTRPGITTGAAT